MCTSLPQQPSRQFLVLVNENRNGRSPTLGRSVRYVLKRRRWAACAPEAPHAEHCLLRLRGCSGGHQQHCGHERRHSTPHGHSHASTITGRRVDDSPDCPDRPKLKQCNNNASSSSSSRRRCSERCDLMTVETVQGTMRQMMLVYANRKQNERELCKSCKNCATTVRDLDDCVDRIISALKRGDVATSRAPTARPQHNVILRTRLRG